MSMIKYSGMSLQEFVGAQIFDPPRLCLVWDDDEFNENTIHEKSYVCVIIPPTCEAEHRVVTCNGVHWKHCALLPEEPTARMATNRELAKGLAQGNGEIQGHVMEIRTRLQGGTPFFPNMLNNGSVEVCLKEDVDKVLAEKDKEIAELKATLEGESKAFLEWVKRHHSETLNSLLTDYLRWKQSN